MNDRSAFSTDLAVLRSTSLTMLVRAEIEKEVISGVRCGGEHLSEQQLTRKFKVSRGPVREALRALEGQGLLEQQKNRGWFVKLLSTREIEEVFQMRGILDNGMARLLVMKSTEANFRSKFDELHELVGRMDGSIKTNSVGEYARNNQAFHDGLLEIIGNDNLTKTYRNMMGQLASHVVNSLSIPGAMMSSNDQHRDILKAIEAGREKELCSLFNKHRQQTHERMSAVSVDSPQTLLDNTTQGTTDTI